ncbi:hypothetical protein [Psychrobacter pygoscelis]|uniref:hypothetical protein n=1 Tax=Psychrobacter pygoscelis TaxID=2488563 RepID=UPI00103F1F91|nr:hypothetical protein [Psychrobacter pygoscelis]
MKISTLHALAGTLAMLLIATFWLATITSELFMTTAAVVDVKHYIAIYGLVTLVILMGLTGGSGFIASKNRQGRLINHKKSRMRIIAVNGLIIMVPSAIFLNVKAAAGEFDIWFYGVQLLELAVGLVQLILMSSNFRAGLQLSSRRRTNTVSSKI